MRLVRITLLVTFSLSFLLSPFPFTSPIAHAADQDTCVSEWTPVPMPVPPGGQPLLSRAASSSSDNVWAVGTFTAGYDSPFQTLIEHWDGNEWKIVPSPNVANHSNQLMDIAIIGKSDAWAVGFSDDLDNVPHILMLRWDGTNWTFVPPPNGLEGQGWLFSVSAVAANDIWAVGAGLGNGLILHWDGTEWYIVPSPIDLGFKRVIAKATDDVWVLGEDGEHNATILHWDGSALTVTTSFKLLVDSSGGGPYYYQERISDFVVPGANDIWVVGTHYYSDQQRRRWHWDGTSWDSSEQGVGISPGGTIHSIAGPSADNLWEYSRDEFGLDTRTLSHRDGTGWHDFDMTAFFPSLSRASLSVVSDQEFWLLGISYAAPEPLAEHGIFTCETPPADQAVLLSPTQGEIITEMNVTFEWQKAANAGYYNLEFTHSPNEPIVLEHQRYLPHVRTLQNGEYTWRVQACNYVGCGPWSNPVTWTQQISVPAAAPQLLSPLSGTSIADNSVRATWASVANTEQYTVVLYQDLSAVVPYRTSHPSENSFLFDNLAEGHYSWRVQACNPSGCSPWSDMFEFTTFYLPPSPLVLLFPTAKATLKTAKPRFGWQKSGEFANYKLKLLKNSPKGEVIGKRNVGANLNYRWRDRLPNGEYYWRVKACNQFGCSKWSRARSFFVQK